MKILLLTSIYPGKDINKSFTPIVHYFAKEWVKMGCEVIVIHNLAYYPKFFYFLSSLFSKLIASVAGTNIPLKRLNKSISYKLDDVEVIRIPIYKLFPRFRFSKKTILIQENKIVVALKQFNFTPDKIIGHWENPQIELISLLKQRLEKSVTCLVFHHKAIFLMNIYKKETKSLLNNIDVFGFRSVPIKNSYQHLLDGSKPDFICYSGIPENFTKEKIYKKFEKKLERFLFVGVLIKRKYPLEIMDALQLSSSKRDFKLNYIGDGFLTKRIENKVHQLNLEKKVKLLGKVSRETVWKEMLKADCFIMISKNEAYGLVYLEAMAAGCITIASRNEGFDGVIKHGFNGFLCESGNKVELSSLIDKINQMDEKNIKEISRNAMFTASALTNFKAAEIYLNKLNL